MTESEDGNRIRLLLAGDDWATRTSIRAMPLLESDIAVVAEATSPEHTAALVARLNPHVIIAACTAFTGDRASAIRRLAAVARTARVLVLTDRPDEEAWLLLALHAGAAGVVSNHASQGELLAAIRAVASGQIVLRRGAVHALTARARHRHESDPPVSEQVRAFARLTDRERSVFQLIAEGYSAPEVGVKLSISKKTVETYKTRIADKLGFSHRAEFVRFALQVGVLVSAPPELTGQLVEVEAGDAA